MFEGWDEPAGHGEVDRGDKERPGPHTGDKDEERPGAQRRDQGQHCNI